MPCSGLKFLVVEDHEIQRHVFVQLLRSLGAAAVHSAEDGRAALQVLRDPDRPVDIVISDLSMPGMDGMEFVRHLSETGAPISLILASALDADVRASIAHMAKAYKVRLLGVIAKPPTALKLAPLVESYKAGAPGAVSEDFTFSFDEIAEAWTHSEFEPWFQPRVDLTTGKLSGFAAVPRWRHPNRATLELADFLPSITARGLEEDFVWLMIQKSTAECRRWAQSGLDVQVAVALSFKSLTEVDLAMRIRQIAKNEGLEPRHLVLTVPEDLIVGASQARALENLARLRVDGFGLGIDEFGTGPLALDELSLIAFTEIKINKAYVRGVHRKDADRAGLAVGLQVAQELRLKAVADGITTEEEWDLLQEWGCTTGQGTLISPPLRASDVIDWSRTWANHKVR